MKKIIKIVAAIILILPLIWISYADSIKLTSEYKELETEFLSDLQKGSINNIENRLKADINELDSLLKNYTSSQDTKINSLILKIEALIELVDDYDRNFSEKDEDIIDMYDDIFDDLESVYKRLTIWTHSWYNWGYNNHHIDSNHFSTLRNDYRKVFEDKLWDSLNKLSDAQIKEMIIKVNKMEGTYKSMNVSEAQKQSYSIQLWVLRQILKEKLSLPTTDYDIIDTDKLFE